MNGSARVHLAVHLWAVAAAMHSPVTVALALIGVLLTGAHLLRRGIVERRHAAVARRASTSRRTDQQLLGASPAAAGSGRRIPRPIVVALARVGAPGEPARWWHGWLACVMLGPLVAWLLAGFGLAVLVGLLVSIAPPATVAGLWGRHDVQIERALPDMLDMVARGLRSGASLPQAFVEAAPVAAPSIADDLRGVDMSMRRGMAFTDALAQWAELRPLPGVRLTVAALSLASEVGGAQAKAVEGVAATLRDRLAIRAERRAASTQARASAAVMALAPIGFAVVAAGLDRRTAVAMVGSPFGVACAGLGLLLDGVATIWMFRLTGGSG
jgi:tight adherence protein B